MTPRPKNPPPDRRQDLLDAALRVFARKGYAAATNAEIAREAGVTAAALYHYFDSKEALFRAALSERQETLLPMFRRFTDNPPDLSPRESLRIMVRNVIDFLSDPRTVAVLKIIMAEGPRSPELIEMWERQVIERAFQLVGGFLQQEVARCAIKGTDPRAMMLIIIGPVIATVMMRDVLKTRVMAGLENEVLADRLADALVDGLLTDNAAAQPREE